VLFVSGALRSQCDRGRSRLSHLTVTPNAVVEAPIERVWSLLTRPDGFHLWVDAAMVAAEPEGRARPGQQLHLVTKALGWAFAITIEIAEVDAERHRLRFQVELPFGVVDDQVVTMSTAEGERTHVSYVADYSFPPGWWGQVLWALRARGLRRGTVDSLRRLKRAVEAPPAP